MRLLPVSEGENEMKRSLRVATVFTGAVAAAAATLAPTAEAEAAVANTLTAGNCVVSSYGTNVHLYYSANAKHPRAACVKGGPGYFSFPGGKKFAGICGGAWSGIFYYGVPGTSISGSAFFTPGYQRHYWAQTDLIYGVSLVGYHYVQGETDCFISN
jgi:hypothetical protein